MELTFSSDYNIVLGKLSLIDPVEYGRTRNYISGAVTYLSPYISRGVISTQQVLKSVLSAGYKLAEIESFVKELCWRDYFQRVSQVKDINKEIKHEQIPVSNFGIPLLVLQAETGIQGIDTAIQELYESGYMHNHCRMYTASLVCNVAQSHWHHPAQWMYYHLLDGDWASNACSWQWVAGANSSKKYFANQDNINKYTLTRQTGTFVDFPYEEIESKIAPIQLLDTKKLNLQVELPESNIIQLNKELPTFVYNYYNLDPMWHHAEPGNRILLLEPNFFSKYPISTKCINFMLALSKNIPEIQIYKGSFESLSTDYNISTITYKEHPLNIGYKGTEEERDWIASEVTGYYPSFFAYWKKVEKQIKSL